MSVCPHYAITFHMWDHVLSRVLSTLCVLSCSILLVHLYSR